MPWTWAVPAMHGALMHNAARRARLTSPSPAHQLHEVGHRQPLAKHVLFSRARLCPRRVQPHVAGGGGAPPQRQARGQGPVLRQLLRRAGQQLVRGALALRGAHVRHALRRMRCAGTARRVQGGNGDACRVPAVHGARGNVLQQQEGEGKGRPAGAVLLSYGARGRKQRLHWADSTD